MAQLPPVRASSGGPSLRPPHGRASRPGSLTSVPSLVSRTSSGGSQGDDDGRHATIPSKYEPLPAIPRRLVRQNTYDVIEPLMLKLMPKPGTAQVGSGEPPQEPACENESAAGATRPATCQSSTNRHKNCDWIDDHQESGGGVATVDSEPAQQVRTLNSLFIDVVLPEGAKEPSQQALSEYTGMFNSAQASSDDVAAYSETIRKKKGVAISALASPTAAASPAESPHRYSREDIEQGAGGRGGDHGDDSTAGVNDDDGANEEATDDSGSSHVDDSVDGEQEKESRQSNFSTDSLEVGAAFGKDKPASDPRESAENNTLRLNNYCVYQQQSVLDRQCQD